MIAAEILLGAHIEVVVTGVVEHGIDGAGAHEPDRRGRQAGKHTRSSDPLYPISVRSRISTDAHCTLNMNPMIC